MQIKFFDMGRGGFVAHGYRVPGLDSRFSVWFGRDGYARDAERKDTLGRVYPVRHDSRAWQYIARHKLAGLDSASAIEKAAHHA